MAGVWVLAASYSWYEVENLWEGWYLLKGGEAGVKALSSLDLVEGEQLRLSLLILLVFRGICEKHFFKYMYYNITNNFS